MVKTKLAKFHLHIYKLLHLVSVSIESRGKSSELENVNLEVDYIAFFCILQKCGSLFVLQSKMKQLCERAAEVDSDNPFDSCTMMEHHCSTITRSTIFTLNEYHKYNQNCTQ